MMRADLQSIANRTISWGRIDIVRDLRYYQANTTRDHDFVTTTCVGRRGNNGI